MLPLMDPSQLVCDGDVDDTLADKGAGTDYQAHLPEEGKEGNKHAGKSFKDDPEDDGEGEHSIADVEKESSKTNEFCYDLRIITNHEYGFLCF